MDFENRNELDEERSRQRRKRIEEMKIQKKRAERLQRQVFPAVLSVAILLTLFVIVGSVRNIVRAGRIEEMAAEVGSVNIVTLTLQEIELAEAARKPAIHNYEVVFGPTVADMPEPKAYTAKANSRTTGFSTEVISPYGVFIDVEDSVILAQREGKKRISPASMTKILTVLTAARALGLDGEDWQSSPVLDERFTITIQITDYSFVNDCSNAGFEIGEEVTVRDLFYGTILPSGADAALGLACYVAGSHEAFVELMNQELEKMDMADTTHIMNCVGLYDEDHYSTVYDIAVILKTAADIPFCREVLSAHTYNTSSTAQHEEGLLVSNWFLRRIEDRETNGLVLCAKTGYVAQSKSCAASLAVGNDGKEYICVTAGSDSGWSCIADQVLLYQKWLKDDADAL